MPKTITKDAALADLSDARTALEKATEAKRAAREALGAAAITAKEAGATHEEVGAAMGLSKQRAFDIVQAARTDD